METRQLDKHDSIIIIQDFMIINKYYPLNVLFELIHNHNEVFYYNNAKKIKTLIFPIDIWEEIQTGSNSEEDRKLLIEYKQSLLPLEGKSLKERQDILMTSLSFLTLRMLRKLILREINLDIKEIIITENDSNKEAFLDDLTLEYIKMRTET